MTGIRLNTYQHAGVLIDIVTQVISPAYWLARPQAEQIKAFDQLCDRHLDMRRDDGHIIARYLVTVENAFIRKLEGMV